MSSHQRSHLCPAGVRVPVHLHARHTVCIFHIILYLLDILYAYILHIINICYNLYIYIFCNKTIKYVKFRRKKKYLLNIFPCSLFASCIIIICHKYPAFARSIILYEFLFSVLLFSAYSIARFIFLNYFFKFLALYMSYFHFEY